MHLKLIDAFGTILAEGDLTVNDFPGAGTNPTVTELLRTHLASGERVTLDLLHIPPALTWSVKVTDV